MEIIFGNQKNYRPDQIFVRNDHFFPVKKDPRFPAPDVMTPEVRTELSVAGSFEPAEGGLFLSVTRLLEIAQTEEGLLSVLSILQHEAANVAKELMYVNAYYDPNNNEFVRLQINNYNQMLIALNSIITSLEEKFTNPSQKVARLKAGIDRSLKSLNNNATELLKKVQNNNTARD